MLQHSAQGLPFAQPECTRGIVHAADDAVLEGALLWADATFLKIRLGDGVTTRIVPKAQIKGLHALSGTGEVAGDEAVGDAWAGRQASLA